MEETLVGFWEGLVGFLEGTLLGWLEGNLVGYKEISFVLECTPVGLEVGADDGLEVVDFDIEILNDVDKIFPTNLDGFISLSAYSWLVRYVNCVSPNRKVFWGLELIWSIMIKFWE